MVYCQNIYLQFSPLFVGDITTKPNKAQLVAELENNLTSSDYQLNPDNPQVTHVLLDFMSKIRQFPNLSTFENFGEVIKCVYKNVHRVCPSLDMVHLVFDSYTELSIKAGEWMRRAGDVSAVDLAVMEESVPIPHQLDKFWPAIATFSTIYDRKRHA